MDDIGFILNNYFQKRIEVLIKHDIEAKCLAKENFRKYLTTIHCNNLKITKYIESPKRRNNLRIHSQFKDIRFEFTIHKDLTSDFRIIVSKMSEIKYDESLIKNRFMPQAGYVYFIYSDFGYKIGFTAKLYKRLKDFGVKLPFKFYLHSTIKCLEYKNIEKFLHDLLKDKNLNGEWFSLTKEDFINIDKILSNMELKREINTDITLQ